MTRTPEQRQALDAALTLGLETGDNDMMRLSLEKGATPDLLITGACGKQRLQAVDIGLLTLALQKGADADLLLFGGIGANAPAVVKLAVEQGGANVNALRKPPGDDADVTAAHWVYQNFQTGIFEYLLGKGMGVDVPGAGGNTPLLRAVLDKDATKTQHYLSRGANPFAANAKGEFPLKVLEDLRRSGDAYYWSAFDKKKEEFLKIMLKNVPDEAATPAPESKAGSFNGVATRDDIPVGHPLELRQKATAHDTPPENDPPAQGAGKGFHL